MLFFSYCNGFYDVYYTPKVDYMEKEVFIKKTITITKEQQDWLFKNCINLSRFVQKGIDSEIKKNGK